ncbi:unnamed protein product [Nippostrongylus brasiliensis]|uniref:CACTA en-spm transposon protein n=1 Tax=Nippostrongylus brasiliensis TaxID=27835 RepID=A0A0N4YT81_NIPBR|nr:unnamed protein product [Nippostrongylus brasiliensis]
MTVSIGDDDHQATVGHGRGKWANDLVDETRKAMNSITEVEEKQIERRDSGYIPGPAVMSTAVIARSSSAPRLQTYKAEDDISVGDSTESNLRGLHEEVERLKSLGISDRNLF